MKANFTAAKLNLSLTTNSGKPIYSYEAENVDIKLNVPALIEGVATIGSMIEQVMRNGGDLSDIEALVANMQQQPTAEGA